jgi:hypothetical protein
MILPKVEPQHTQQARPERGTSGRSVIKEAKALVPTIDLADLLAGPDKMRRVGAEWVTNCILPDHEDKTPSFTINPEKNVWFCHGCVRGGDVVELARLSWGYAEREVPMAAAGVLRAFGHEVPSRPESWSAKQRRQDPVRRAIEAAKTRRVQRRIYRWILAPPLAAIADDDERLEEAGRAWEDAGHIARLLVARTEVV